MTKERPKNPKIAFIIGSPRSGTTLLRVMLDGHSKLFSPPEMLLGQFETMRERKETLAVRYWEKGGLRRALMALHGIDVEAVKKMVEDFTPLSTREVHLHIQKTLGDRILVDKCPHLAMSELLLEAVERDFEEPVYIWIYRHPWAVIRSLLAQPMFKQILGPVIDLDDNPAEFTWREGNANLEAFFKKIPPERVVEVKYETLVAEPRPLLEACCKAIGIPFEEALLHPYEGDRMREGPKGARAIGDPQMAARGKVQPELATSYLDDFDSVKLKPETRALASRLGYAM